MTHATDRAREAYFRAVVALDPVRLRFWDERGTTMTQLRVMHLIRQKCEPSTGELAIDLHIRPATLTGLADRLEQKGLIKRWSDTHDRRVVRLGLTDEGSMLLNEAAAAGRASLDAIFARMTAEDVDAFTRAVSAFVEAATDVSVEAVPEPQALMPSP
jgi:DNA-binding MarR family transcriptional regulator